MQINFELEKYDLDNFLSIQKQLKINDQSILRLALSIMAALTEDFSQAELEAVLGDIATCKQFQDIGA
jgi:hypothetical protein